MLNFIYCLLEVFTEINQYNYINICRYLETNEQIITNVIGELNNRQINHWSELSFRDRALLIDATLERENMEQDIIYRM